MKTIKDLLNTLDHRYPFADAEKWDNVGLLLGSKQDNLNEVFVSLELTSEVINQLPTGSTIITHHPLIFSALKSIDFNTYQGKLIRELIKKDISYIALHTNYDTHFLNKYFIQKILKKDIIEGNGVDYFHCDYLSYIQAAENISEYMNVDNMTFKLVYGGTKKIQKIAVCTGSGSSYLREAKENGADILITGDIGYHTAIEAKEIGISLIDITHYHSEKYFGDDLVEDFGYIKIDSGNPFA